MPREGEKEEAEKEEEEQEEERKKIVKERKGVIPKRGDLRDLRVVCIICPNVSYYE